MISILRWMGGAAVVGFVMSVFTPVWNYAGSLIVVPPVIATADAVVVLGAGMRPDGTFKDESLRRAVHGIQLFKQGLAPVLVLSGSSQREHRERSEAEARRDLAMRMGIPTDRILLNTKALTTREEAIEIAPVLAERGAVTVLLVTQGLHMRRAMRVFERAGLKVLPAPSDNNPASALSPADRLLLMREILQQGVALVYYRLAGYM